MNKKTKTTPDIIIVYDDRCPFCRNYCQLVKIKEAAGDLILIDARQDSEIMNEITANGLDIDHGMVVKINKKLYYGADAIHILALMSTKSGVFNRLNAWIFKSKRISSLIYPILKNLRNLTLKLIGVPLIQNLHKD